MTEGPRFILNGKEPVPCDNIADWQAFMDDIEGRTVAQDVVGKFHISTTFEGTNLGTSTKRRFFLTVVAEREDSSYLSETWEQAESKHRAVMRCADGLSNLTSEKIANGHRFVGYGVQSDKLWFVMESEETAIAALPQEMPNWHWHREGRTIVLNLPVTEQ